MKVWAGDASGVCAGEVGEVMADGEDGQEIGKVGRRGSNDKIAENTWIYKGMSDQGLYKR